MLEDEFIVPKFGISVWDKEMISDFLIDSSINQPFQEADLSDTSGRYNSKYYRLREFLQMLWSLKEI